MFELSVCVCNRSAGLLRRTDGAAGGWLCHGVVVAVASESPHHGLGASLPVQLQALSHWAQLD